VKTSKKRNEPTSRKEKAAHSKVIRGSGNVFADMGMPDAEERLSKARLAHEICALIADKKLTQVQAAKKLGIDQPKISALMRGRLEAFSTDRLLRFITSLDRDVWIVIREPKEPHHGGVRVLVEA